MEIRYGSGTPSTQIRREGQSTVGNKFESSGMQLVLVSSYDNCSPLRSPSGKFRNAGCSKVLSRFHSITAQSNCWRHVPETVNPVALVSLKAAIAEGRSK